MWHPSFMMSNSWFLSLEIQVWNASIKIKGAWLDSMCQAMETPSLHWGKWTVLGPAQRQRRARCQTLREWPLTRCTIREAPAVPRHHWLQNLASVWWSKSCTYLIFPVCLVLGKKQDEAYTAPPTFHKQLSQGLVASSEQRARSQSIGATYRLRWLEPVCCHHISFTCIVNMFQIVEDWETGWAGVCESLHPRMTALTHKRWVYGKCTKNVPPLWFLKKKRLWAWFRGFSLSFDRTIKAEWLSWAPDTIPIKDFFRPEATFALRIVARQHPQAVGLKNTSEKLTF